jgi:hypothetical protein
MPVVPVGLVVPELPLLLPVVDPEPGDSRPVSVEELHAAAAIRARAVRAVRVK